MAAQREAKRCAVLEPNQSQYCSQKRACRTCKTNLTRLLLLTAAPRAAKRSTGVERSPYKMLIFSRSLLLMGATARSEANHCAVLEPNQSQPYDSYSDFSTIADDVTSHVTLTQIVLATLTIVIRSVDCSAEVLAREVCRTSSLAIVNELSLLTV